MLRVLKYLQSDGSCAATSDLATFKHPVDYTFQLCCCSQTAFMLRVLKYLQSGCSCALSSDLATLKHPMYITLFDFAALDSIIDI